MAETELERAEKRFAQAKARVQALRNREATKQRKLDTRRKVILGGALVDLAARDDRAVEMLERLVRNLVRAQDRAAFEGWDWRAEKGGEVGEIGTGGETDAAGVGGTGDFDGGNTGVMPGADEIGVGNSGEREVEGATVPGTAFRTIAAEKMALRVQRLASSSPTGRLPNFRTDWVLPPKTSEE